MMDDNSDHVDLAVFWSITVLTAISALTFPLAG